MPWQNQGGGPWGGGGQGPWGGRRGGSGGGGNQPPDLEELLRKSQDRMKQFIPGGGSGKGLVLIIAAAILVWLATGIYRVQPNEQGVVLLFGKAVDTTEPGLHVWFPAPIGEVLTPQVTRSNRTEIGYRGGAEYSGRSGAVRDVPEESLMLTGDENIVDMDFAVLWRIKDAKDFLFNLRDPEGTVKAVAESAMREVVGQTTFDRAVTVGREEIEQRTKALMQGILDAYGSGILIANVQLQKSDPPKEVIDAFNDVQRARQDRDRLQNEAEAYANSIVPEARGKAEKAIQEATAYREQQLRGAEGEAQRFLSVLEAYKTAPDVTKRRMYLETIGQVLGDANKVIIDQSKGAQGVVPYLPLPEIQRRQGQSEQNSGQASGQNPGQSSSQGSGSQDGSQDSGQSSGQRQ